MSCSHINQKTQFENPVLEAKRKLSLDTPSSGQQGATTPSGNTSLPALGHHRLLVVMVTNWYTTYYEAVYFMNGLFNWACVLYASVDTGTEHKPRMSYSRLSEVNDCS